MNASLANNSDYVNSLDYQKLNQKLTEMKAILDDVTDKTVAARRLRYEEVDIEVEREAGRIQPDELFIPVHTIDTNIRREQSPYIQYMVQSNRAVILKDVTDPKVDLSQLETDLTSRLRYQGWQRPIFACIDAMQSFGYGIVEVVYDASKPGNLAIEHVQQSDFGFVSDTREIQSCEMLGRVYHYTRTKLIDLCGDPKQPKDSDWDRDQVEKLLQRDSKASTAEPLEPSDDKDRSLYRVEKIMFRYQGTVYVAWTCIGIGDDWLRTPRPLFLGRQKQQPVVDPATKQPVIDPQTQQPKSEWVNDFETNYPFFLFQYLIDENDTISHLKGRIYLDQDVQEGLTSLTSSTCTQARRAAGCYFSLDTDDPNADIAQQKNIFFKQGALIPAKVKMFQVTPPDPGIFRAIQMIAGTNQQETSQINFAETNNQRDSRKTAAAVNESRNQRTELTTVQVVLLSLSVTELYNCMVSIIKSRVLASLIQTIPEVVPMYQRTFTVKPSGDVDVVEKEKLIQAMIQGWAIIQNTAASVEYMCDLLELVFPNTAAKYCNLIRQQQQQQQGQQAQQQQQLMQFVMQMAKGIVTLADHKDYFSETGQLHAYPVVQQTAEKIKDLEKQQQGKQPQL